MSGCDWHRYELCSEYGLYVVDEANVESHGFDGSLKNNDRQLTNDMAWCAHKQLASCRWMSAPLLLLRAEGGSVTGMYAHMLCPRVSRVSGCPSINNYQNDDILKGV